MVLRWFPSKPVDSKFDLYDLYILNKTNNSNYIVSIIMRNQTKLISVIIAMDHS